MIFKTPLKVKNMRLYFFPTKIVFNTSLAAKGALANRLQRPTACKIQNGRQGLQNGRQGLEKGVHLGLWALPSTFAK